MSTQDDLGSSATELSSEESSEQEEFLRGTTMGRYVIIEPIGAGGMGAVYRAYDPKLNRGVALKILSVQQADSQVAEKAKTRLIREAQALAQLSHPNVVAVHDVGSVGDVVFIAMELVEGETLKSWMSATEHTTKEILEIMSAAGRGLSAAHQAGLVHRDFKPGNVVVGNDGRVRVLDFGLARAIDSEIAEEHAPARDPESFQHDLSSGSNPGLLQIPITRFGGRVGTPMYMAPEQHLGKKTDERTDQFGFCLVLYEALYGIRPFEAKTIEELTLKVSQHRVTPPPPESKIPGWLWRIIDKGLSAHPKDRYASLDALLADLRKDPDEQRRQRRQIRKRRFGIIGIVLLAITLPVSIWYGLRYGTVLQCMHKLHADTTRVWGSLRQNKIRQAFFQTRASYAKSTWERVRNTFDQYVADWQTKRTDLCESSWLGAQSRDFYTLQLRCLTRRLTEFEKLSQIFARADASVVKKAVQAAANLSSLAQCMSEDTLTSRLALPHETIKAEVESLRGRLLTVKVLLDAGKYKSAKDLAKGVLAQTEKLGYRPLLAESYYWTGDAQERLGKYDLAEQMLRHAYDEALESAHFEVMALAGIQLTWVLGYRLSRAQEGLCWGKTTKTAIALLGWPPALASKWNDEMGLVYFALGEEQKALHFYQKALEIIEQHLGQDHLEVAVCANRIGVFFWKTGVYDQALKYIRRAFTINQKVLGMEHPQVATNLNNIGLVLWKKGEYQQASQFLGQAMDSLVAALGQDHPLVAWPLSVLGDVQLALGQVQQALDKFSQVVELCNKDVCYPEPEGIAYFGLAKGSWAQLKDCEKALAYATKARQVYSKAAKFRREQEAIEAWLQALQGCN